MATLKEQFWDPVAGFGVTFRTMFRKVVTEQYPKEKFPTAPRFPGRHSAAEIHLSSVKPGSTVTY